MKTKTRIIIMTMLAIAAALPSTAATNWVIYASAAYGMTPIQQLTNAVANAQSGDTITLKEGTYAFSDEAMSVDADGTKNFLKINVNNLTIVGEDDSSRTSWTGESEPVVLDGANNGRIVYVNSSKTGVTFRNIAFARGKVTASAAYGGAAYCQADTTFTNCVFKENYSANRGAAVFSGVIRDCLVTNNFNKSVLANVTAYGCEVVGNPVQAFQYGSAYGCDIHHNVVSVGDVLFYATPCTDCTIRYNKAKYQLASGALLGCTLEGNTNTWNSTAAYLFACATATNCIFRRNYSYGFVLGTDVRSLSGCVFEGNSAASAGVYLNANGVNAIVDRCTFTSNETRSFSATFGDGGCGAALKVARASDKLCTMTVTNCTFTGNSANGTGGAIYASSSVPGEEPWAGVTVGCSAFTNNVGTHVAGVCGIKARNCVFEKNVTRSTGYNFRGGDAALSRLEECECTGGNLYMCLVDRSRIHDVTNVCVFNIGCNVTNTLVSKCVLGKEAESIIGRYYNLAGFVLEPSSFVNCTFAANKADFFAHTNIVSMANCAFFDNTNRAGVATAISLYQAANSLANGSIAFDYCAFGHLAVTVPAGTNLFEVDPKFAAAPPWSPSLRSPLREAGLVQDWMATATDIVGRPRLRDGRVDIGCYECWLREPGMMMIVK